VQRNDSATERGLSSDFEGLVNSLHAQWDSAGRTGRPRIVVLDMQKSDVSRLSQWAGLGVSEVVYGMPDKSTEEVQAYLDTLVGQAGRIRPARRRRGGSLGMAEVVHRGRDRGSGPQSAQLWIGF
jgi:hypothetical protein